VAKEKKGKKRNQEGETTVRCRRWTSTLPPAKFRRREGGERGEKRGIPGKKKGRKENVTLRSDFSLEFAFRPREEEKNSGREEERRVNFVASHIYNLNKSPTAVEERKGNLEGGGRRTLRERTIV